MSAAAEQAASTQKPTQTQGSARSWRRRLLVVAGPLALAGATLIYVVVQRGPSGPELPAYAVAAGSAGAPTEARLRVAQGKGARFELLLRPTSAPQGKVVAYPFMLTQPGAEPETLDAKVEISPEGLIHLSGASRSLEGAGELRIVVGVPTDIGKFDDAIARAKSGTSDAHVRVLVVTLDRG